MSKTRRTLVLAALSLAVLTGVTVASEVPSAQASDSRRPIMAYYYGWWTESTWHSTSNLPPETYESSRDQVMRRQIEQARSAGITAFVCTWEYNCERLLEIAEEMGGFSVAFSVDPLAEHKLDSWGKLVNGMERMSRLAESPAYLRWNGKPVFVFWDSWILPGNSTVNDFRALRDQVDPGRNQHWLGGGTDFSYLDVFDSIHYFDISWESQPGAAMSSYNRNLSGYNSTNGMDKPFVATVMPGYDDRQIRGGRYRPREDGAYYRSTWEAAYRYEADAVMITSWNEWYEGSQIEPARSYGHKYIDITRQRAALYRTQPGNFADPGFERTWSREDLAVRDGRASRTWVWGYPRGDARTEPYDGQPRTVQYFDKTRMEINDPNADPASLWYVTNGLLATEMITGRMQVGDDAWVQRPPAGVNVAGDGDDLSGPTYSTFNDLLDEPPTPEGETVTARIDHSGVTGDDSGLAGYGATAEYHVAETNHTVASAFWDYMTSTGEVFEDGHWTSGSLFANPFYATGYPITEPYWTHVRVGGDPKDVLVQCFERRCLTFTPSNPAGWQVEMANVGQHYHRWRYGWSW